MKKQLVRLPLALMAARELGIGQLVQYARYQAGLRSGYFRRATPLEPYRRLAISIAPLYRRPDREQMEAVLGEHVHALITEADEICEGQVRLFGGPPVALSLVPPDASRHWTYYENRPDSWGVEDIKFIWEPARFGWAYTLGRAFTVTQNTKYSAVFWKFLEQFLDHNPPNQGPNWSSAQEVALRLLALLFASSVFSDVPVSTQERMDQLSGVIAAHARRIPVTMSYARAQNNNHLVTEALGLYAAGCALAGLLDAGRWRKHGWTWLNKALLAQIHADGTYVQHSMNYHRLMLSAALQAPLFGQAYPQRVVNRLSEAAAWLLAQVDPASGQAPNLGANDGANILPLASGGFNDYRPITQAAARAFLRQPAFPPGPWDELGYWLGQPMDSERRSPAGAIQSIAVHRLEDPAGWAILRAVHFDERPSHADQLHVDIWWHGENIAMDPGTYRYTAADPWNNSLAQTFVHNTVEVNGQNQMQRGGRFLWLNWAQARLLQIPGFSRETIAAQHDGYFHLGVTHCRILKHAGPGRWQVIDHFFRGSTLRLNISRSPVYPYRLHWLLPDWPWELDRSLLELASPGGGRVRLRLEAEMPDTPLNRIESISLVRAGQALAGPENSSPILGWYSPAYNLKIPALSFSLTVRSMLPFSLVSDWRLVDSADLPGS